MSLLMDALKKAEQEKKKAAEKHKQSAAGDQPAPGSEAAREQAPQPAPRSGTAQPAPAAGLTLEPIEQRAEITDEFTIVNAREQQADDDPDLNISIDRIRVDRAEEDEFEQTGKQPIPGAEKSMAALRDELDEEERNEGTFYGVELEGQEAAAAAMYEETLQGEPYEGRASPQLYDETLPGVSAVELARDIGDENQPTPVAAQTIFAASASRRTASGLKWTMTVMGLIIAIVIAVGVLFYQTESITPRELPSPLVARGIEDIVPAQTLALVSSEPVTGTLIQQQASPRDVMQEVLPPLPAAASPESTPAPAREPVPAPEVTQARAAPALPGGAAQAGAIGSAPESAAAGVPEASPPQQLPAEIEVTHALFKISRSKGPDKRAAIVNEAYAAYQEGDYAAAKVKYAKIVRDFPDSRDGLLGVGAIAMYEHDWERAFAVYSRLLTLDPGNNIAKAALINLVGESAQANRESAIKLMLNDNPESSYLYFSLGNVYASQLRWAEAQQAYFDAYRYDSANPNYALNLAIALDRLGQMETALDYYNTALKLATGKQSGFDEARVLARIETISANLN